ncbi:IS256 family transposase ISAs3 [Oligella sp. MSHR50489EDL]
MVSYMTKNDDLIKSLIKQLNVNPTDGADIEALADTLRKHLYETALAAELDAHLGYEKHAKGAKQAGNSRNGYSKKTLKGNKAQFEIAVPRDRNATFEPQIVKKHQTRTGVLDDQIIALYGKGMTTREIADTLQEFYDVDVSPMLISHVTEKVMEELKEWQNRPLDNLYPIVYLDCIVLKVRENQRIVNKSIYIALGVNPAGHKELLGLWIAQNEGARFWLGILTELKNRGLEDILIACVDGLKGFPEAIEAVYPQTKVQLCIVHMVRNTMRFVSWKDARAVTKDLKAIYQAATESEGLQALDAFESRWPNYAFAVQSWRNHWHHVATLFAYPEDIRRAIYTTNAIESLNSVIRKATKRHKLFPNDEAALKVVYLAIHEASKKWTMPIRNWRQALNQFSIEFEDRFLNYL